MSKAQELKPCPFCGGAPQLVDNRMGWFVRCDHCRPFKTVIYGNNVRHLDHEEDADLGAVDWDALKQSAIDAWNRRAPASSEQQAALQDAGEAISDLAYALDMLVGKNAAHSLCIHEPMDAMGRVKGTWSAAAEVNARATLKLHASVIIAARASNGGKA